MSAYALRLPESLKLAAKRIAAQDDTTMNQFFVVAIAEKSVRWKRPSFEVKKMVVLADLDLQNNGLTA